jgi:uncharacterized protein (TIGR02996 family)
MSTLQGLLNAIVADAQNEDRYLVLADWLEEHDDARRAELVRLHRRLLATCCEPEKHPERAAWQARMVQLLMEGQHPCVPRLTIPLAKGVAMTFCWLPPGSFLMGSPETAQDHLENETLHRVTLSEGYWMASTPVTQGQWETVMGYTDFDVRGKALPVQEVSWEESRDFCLQVSNLTGRRQRLPTEAEWEYACRAGTTTSFFFGEMITARQASFSSGFPYDASKKGRDRKRATAVGSFPCNAWGLYDMHGNVWEWCQDWYGPYRRTPVRNPTGPRRGTKRVQRGGSWGDHAGMAFSAYRLPEVPTDSSEAQGFRVVLCPDE